ncbi:MAG: DUF4968 domain-containing protein, partial [Prevotella sp.]|nr:DUF4968 domain-containing protein [Prevotella sp.]
MGDRKFLIIAFLLMLVKSVSAAKVTERVYTSAQGALRIQVCNSRMVRITKMPTDRFPADEPWMVVKYDFDAVHCDWSKEGDAYVIKTSDMVIRIKPDPWLITMSNLQGKVLYQETDAVAAEEGRGPSTTCVLQPDEHFFGFGERMDQLDQRGQKIHLNVGLGSGPKPAVGGKDILRANYCPVPFFISSKGYALFFHNAAPTDWDMGWTHNDRYTYSATAGALD